MSKTYKDYPVLPSGRINYSKISGSLELPNLVEIQTDSYKWFLNTGIEEVMNRYTYTFKLKKTGIEMITATLANWEDVTAGDDDVHIK